MDYQNLPTSERIRLTIKAIAKKDPQEVRRLSDSCPVKTVEVADLEYLNTTRMLTRVAMMFELEMRGIALTMATNLKSERGDILNECLDQAVAAKEAWAEFCQQYKLSPEELISSAGGHHPAVAGMMQTTLEPRSELVEHWRKLFQIAASGEVLGEKRH